jgi:hypothetical protein
MASTDKAWQQGRKDAGAGKGASNQSNQSWQVRQSYQAGYQSAKKGSSGK